MIISDSPWHVERLETVWFLSLETGWKSCWPLSKLTTQDVDCRKELWLIWKIVRHSPRTPATEIQVLQVASVWFPVHETPCSLLLLWLQGGGSWLLSFFLENCRLYIIGSRLEQMVWFHPLEGNSCFDDGFTVASAQRNWNWKSH